MEKSEYNMPMFIQKEGDTNIHVYLLIWQRKGQRKNTSLKRSYLKKKEVIYRGRKETDQKGQK